MTFPPQRKVQELPHSTAARLVVFIMLVAIALLSAGVIARREATPAHAPAPHPFAADPAWVAHYGLEGIGLIHPDGTRDHMIDNGVPGESLLANWWPVGEWIVFTSVTPDTRSLWAIPAEGGDPIVLAPGGIYTYGTWQPTLPAETTLASGCQHSRVRPRSGSIISTLGRWAAGSTGPLQTCNNDSTGVA